MAEGRVGWHAELLPDLMMWGVGTLSPTARIEIIGFGSTGKIHAEGLAQCDGAEVTAIAAI